MIKLTFVVVVIFTGCIYSTYTQTTSDCGKDYGCFRHPSKCVDTNCDFIYKWKNNNNNIDFIITSKLLTNMDTWVAIGFSKDQKMGDDSLAICKSKTKVVHSYYNPPPENGKPLPPVYAAPANTVIGISAVEVTESNGFLICKFTRQKSISGQTNFFDLSTKHYVLAAKGNYTNAGTTDTLSPHLAAVSGTELISFTSSTVNTEVYPISHECATGYTCIRSPKDCKDTTCTFIYKWKNNNKTVDFELAGKTTTFTNKWMAIGFSKDSKMGNDSVVVCKSIKKVESYYTATTPDYIDKDKKELGITNGRVIENNQHLVCFFSRDKQITPTNSKYYELDNKYYPLAALGDLDPATLELKQHSENYNSDQLLLFGTSGTKSIFSNKDSLIFLSLLIIATSIMRLF